MKSDDATTIYAQMGMAALLPGMQFMLERMQAELDAMREQLAGMQNGHKRGPVRPPKEVSAVRVEATTNGHPRNRPSPARAEAAEGYWARMTPEERSIEMRRRQKLSASKKTHKLHPRDAAHPDHAVWLEMMRAIQQKRWKKLGKAGREAMQRKMKAGRKKQAKTVREALNGSPTVRMEATA